MFGSSVSLDATTRPDVPPPAMTISKLSESKKDAEARSIRSCEVMVLDFGRRGIRLISFGERRRQKTLVMGLRDCSDVQDQNGQDERI